MGRPSKYSKIIAEEILSRYVNDETLSKICKDKHMPKRTTIYCWRKNYTEFGEAYLLAQEEHVDALVDEAGQIVDSEPDAQRERVRVNKKSKRGAKRSGKDIEAYYCYG